MSIALLPFHAGSNTPNGFARQLSHFTADIIRTLTGVEIQAVNYMAQIEEDPPRYANINPSEKLNEPELIKQFFNQSQVDSLIDGLVEKKENESYHVTIRFFKKGSLVPNNQIQTELNSTNFFDSIREMASTLAQQITQQDIPLSTDNSNFFGTLVSEAFVHFLEGYDTLQYVERTKGQVSNDFNFQIAFDELNKAIQLDPDWDAPLMTLLQLSRAYIQNRIGDVHSIENILKEILSKHSDDARVHFALAELYAQTGQGEQALSALEKAHEAEPNEPSILTQLGILQAELGMPHNAEKNIRKAMEMEGAEKQSADVLAQILSNTGRVHEVPGVWKKILESDLQNSQIQVKYALALMANNQETEALRAFDTALELIEDNTLIKRYYAPILVQKNEIERAMDYYEDCIEMVADDVPLLIEYAQTLQTANRHFEIPKILKDILHLDPHPNTKANIHAWLTELENPQHMETLQKAQNKIEQGNPESAIQDLKPLTTWFKDYWKVWGLLAAAYNRAKQHEQAIEAAQNAITLFPACEPAYGELATAFSSLDKHEDAYNSIKTALSEIENSVPLILNFALAAKRTGRSEEAKAITRQLREANKGENKELDQILDQIEQDMISIGR